MYLTIAELQTTGFIAPFSLYLVPCLAPYIHRGILASVGSWEDKTGHIHVYTEYTILLSDTNQFSYYLIIREWDKTIKISLKEVYQSDTIVYASYDAFWYHDHFRLNTDRILKQVLKWAERVAGEDFDIDRYCYDPNRK